MATEAGRAIYQQRAPAVEGAFARIKHHMGIRAFLLRGLENVRTEWRWICAAYNFKMLMNLVAKAHRTPQNLPRKPNKRLLGSRQTPWWAIRVRRSRNHGAWLGAA